MPSASKCLASTSGCFFLVFSLLFYSLVPQISSEKLFRPQTTTPITISEHVWSCRDVFAGILFWVNLGLVHRNCVLWPLLAGFHIISYHVISFHIMFYPLRHSLFAWYDRLYPFISHSHVLKRGSMFYQPGMKNPTSSKRLT